MFWELYQLGAISEAKTTAAKAAAQAGNLGERLTRLEHRTDRLMQLEYRMEGLALACQALWEISSEELNVTRERLVEKMQEVDLRDGKLDGRMKRQVHECPDCGRKSPKEREKCFYCGASLPDDGHLFAT